MKCVKYVKCVNCVRCVNCVKCVTVGSVLSVCVVADCTHQPAKAWQYLSLVQARPCSGLALLRPCSLPLAGAGSCDGRAGFRES